MAEARDPGGLPPPTLPEVAFAGRSNVGKSTLLNAICQRKGLARTSRTPGCTRGVVLFDLRLRGGASFRLVDLPGYGFADRSKAERRSWGAMIEGYLSAREALRGVMILVDVRRGPEREEAELVEYLHAINLPFVLVATKVDKLSRADRGVALKQLARDVGARVVGVSGETGEGREDLMRAMLALLPSNAPEPTPPTEA